MQHEPQPLVFIYYSILSQNNPDAVGGAGIPMMCLIIVF